MAVYPGASYRPLNQYTNGRMHSYRGAVLHVNVSDGPSLYNWIASNPSRPNDQMSCHFQVATSGAIEQYIDTSLSSWCQSSGNDDWISIETQGFPEFQLSDAQVTAIAGLYAWLHATHGIPFQTTEDPNNGHGFIWHGAGGNSWGGHPSCPGELRKAQRQTIVDLAAGHAAEGGGTPISPSNPVQGDDDMPAMDVAPTDLPKTLDVEGYPVLALTCYAQGGDIRVACLNGAQQWVPLVNQAMGLNINPGDGYSFSMGVGRAKFMLPAGVVAVSVEMLNNHSTIKARGAAMPLPLSVRAMAA